jgi:hypothetical protein
MREAGPSALSASPILVLSVADATAPHKEKVSLMEGNRKQDCATHNPAFTAAAGIETADVVDSNPAFS